MPTYSYRCSACEHGFEAFQKFSDAPLTDCPECGGSISRVIHPVGVVFKGSGWYITDSRNKGSSRSTTNGKAEKKAAEPAAASTTPSETPAAD